jgi:uncharacterized RDD family membrane protein YckC
MIRDLDDYLTAGVMTGRCIAWLLDLIFIALLMALFYWVLGMFGVLTLGFGFGLLPAVSAVPFCYHMFSLLGRHSATPGQRILGLSVRRHDDLGPPTFGQAAVSTVLYYATLATSGLLLLVALVTRRHRTLHDLLSGLVVVRRKALESLTPGVEPWTMYLGSLDRPA